MWEEEITILHIFPSFFLVYIQPPSSPKKQVLSEWSRNPLPLNPTWELLLTCIIFCITAAKALQEAVCRKTTMNNNTVIIQVDPPISPSPLCSHSIFLVFPPGSQTYPVLCGVRAFQQDGDHHCNISHEREMLRESPFNLIFYRPNTACLQAYQPEISTLMHTLEIWLG